MLESRLQRKLAAILYADVAGYSRLTGEDEEGTHRRVSSYLDVFKIAIQTHNGTVVHFAGDAVLADFPTISDALTCAVAFQSDLAEKNKHLPHEKKVQFRVGVNLGEVIVDRDDIYGNGVNVAARLESLADVGGICISGAVYDTIGKTLSLNYEFMGEQQVKNIETPVRTYRVLFRDMLVEPSDDGYGATTPDRQTAEQDIRFCTTPDGVSIAYATVGDGPPLVKAGNWLTHLEFDWRSPVWQHVFGELSKHHLLVRYDARGNGLSDWDVDEISFDAFVRDLETVVDAVGIERFALLGISQGAAVSIAYAVRHPERVTHLILLGGYARGWYKRSRRDKEQGAALVSLIREGWGQDNPAFRQMFTSLFIPGATSEQMAWFNELERITASPENAARIRHAKSGIDVTPLLPQVSVPALVLHAKGDAVAPFAEGRKLAAGIPKARFVPLDSRNHLLLEHEPAWPHFLSEVKKFLHCPTSD